MSTNYVPAIKARMGDWTYYITKMKFGEVANQVKLADEIHKNKDLDDLIQRDLSERVAAMTKFLLDEPQRFYGSLVVAIYKGNPVFRPIKIDEGNAIVDEVDHSFGLLQMDGSQTYFALDGQHRLSSIKDACEQNPDLKSEEISVLVIKHDESLQGLVRTRRLFTKLNRYAKATDHKTNIALDEDDCIAILTRRMAREYKNFKDIVKIDATGKQLSSGKPNYKYMTTLAALYECNLELAGAYNSGALDLRNKEFFAKRPDDDLLDGLYNFLVEVWDELFSNIPHLAMVAQGVTTPGKLREDINSIWHKPVVQMLVCEVVRDAILNDVTVNHIAAKLGGMPAALDDEPWANVIYDVNLKIIKSGKVHRDLLVDLLPHALGFPTKGSSKKDVKERYGEYYKLKSKEIPSL